MKNCPGSTTRFDGWTDTSLIDWRRTGTAPVFHLLEDDRLEHEFHFMLTAFDRTGSFGLDQILTAYPSRSGVDPSNAGKQYILNQQYGGITKT
jgi:hypothetical protein